MSERKGPGETRWKANEDGSISCIRWNDPDWRTEFVHCLTRLSPERLARLLGEAYDMGRRDQAELLRRTINYGATP